MYKLVNNEEWTDEIKHAFKYGITRAYLKVLDGSGLIINEDNYLQSIDFDDERYVDGEGIIGSTVAKSLEGKFINVDSEFNIENKELQAYIGAELDDGTTKYINLGTFIVQKPDNNNVTDNTSFNALDYMVKFNKKFEDRLDYSKRNVTIADLLQDICDQCEVICGTTIFRNSTFIIENNQFINNESCRDVLKAIAQMAFSWARINQDNELVLDFNLSDEITETINNDEYYELKDNEQYGPINTIILRNSQVEGENYTIIDPNKLSTDKTCELVINDNPFAYTQAKRQELIQAGSALFGFKYIPLTTKTIGSVYLNCQDKLRVKNMQDKNLDTYIFNNKISYDGRITDTKETSAMTETETKYQFTDTMANKLNAKMARTEIIVDKANQQITAVVEQIGDRSEKTTTITADIDGLNSKVEEITVLTNSVTGNKIKLENCAYNEITELVIIGDIEVLTLADDAIGYNGTVPMPDLAPLGTLAPSKPQKQSKATYVSDSTYLLDTTLIHIKPDNTIVKISLPDFTLRTLGEIKDEFHIKDGKAYVIQKIELDDAGYKYVLDETKTIELGTINLILEEGTNTLYMEGFPNATLTATYMTKNELVNNFATKVELSTSIKQTSTEIMSEVSKKVDEEEFGTKIVQDYQSVQIAWNKIDELIQFINGKLKILNQNKETLMTLDKLGQHFFSNDSEFGNMGINVVDNKKYISFSVDGEYGSSTNNGMAWGVTTKSDNKFFPILFIENFNIAQKDAGDYGGQLVLTACDLVLQGIGTGVISGNVKMYGNDLTNGLIFEDTATEETLLEIIPNGSPLYTYPRIRFLNGAIDFFRNQTGSNSFKIGNSLLTDENILIIGTDNDIGSITVHGNVYANNISSDKRIKENIQDSNVNALEIIKKIKHKQFYKKDDKKHYDIGYIAQDMEEIDPNFVIKREKTEHEEERYYINELPIIATLSKAIQEQQEIIEQLQNKINELEEKIND